MRGYQQAHTILTMQGCDDVRIQVRTHGPKAIRMRGY